MTCTMRGCTRKAKFYRPRSQVAICTLCFRAHRHNMRRQGFEEKFKRLPKWIGGRLVEEAS